MPGIYCQVEHLRKKERERMRENERKGEKEEGERDKERLKKTKEGGKLLSSGNYKKHLRIWMTKYFWPGNNPWTSPSVQEFIGLWWVCVKYPPCWPEAETSLTQTIRAESEGRKGSSIRKTGDLLRTVYAGKGNEEMTATLINREAMRLNKLFHKDASNSRISWFYCINFLPVLWSTYLPRHTRY